MSSLLAVSLWQSGRVSVSHTGDSGLKYSTFFKNNIILSLNSVKTLRENSTETYFDTALRKVNWLPLKFSEDIIPFCGATDTPVLDFLVTSALSFKLAFF